MAFTPDTLSAVVQSIGGTGIRMFTYETDDTVDVVTGTDYFANGKGRGMRESDLIFVSRQSGAQDPYILVVETVDADGNATASVGIDATKGLNPYMFGAVGDGVADDLVPLNRMFAAGAAIGATCSITGGTFAVIAGSPVVPSNSIVLGAGGTIWQKTPGHSSILNKTHGEFSGLLIDAASTDVTIDGVTIRGPYWPISTVYRTMIGNGGTGYSASFAVTGAGGVTGTATAVAGVVTSITITNSGSDHAGNRDRVNLNFTAGGGTGAIGFGLFQDTTSRSIGISVRGRLYDFYYGPGSDWPNDPTGDLPAFSRRIYIRNCDIEGFGQSGVFADNIDEFELTGNRIYRCGRDGCMMLGVTNGRVTHNRIRQMAPGFLGQGIAPFYSAYGISATRVYNSTGSTGSIADYRKSEHIVISDNVVSECWTWKGLDTHGGTDITFSNNDITNCHVGIGVDKGGYDNDDGISPPRRIMIADNRISHDRDTLVALCGLSLVAHENTTTNRGEDLMVTNNIITGYGEDDVSGGVILSNYHNVQLIGNTFHNCYRCAVSLQGTVEDFMFTDNIISDIAATTLPLLHGFSFIGANFRGVIDNNIFRKEDTADTMIAVNLGAQGAGFGVVMGAGNRFQGAVTFSTSSGLYLANDSPYMLRTFAWGNITVSGAAASILIAKGVASVSYVSTGRYEITLSNALSATSSAAIIANARTNVFRSAVALVTSTTTIEVYLFDAAGVAADSSFFFELKGY